MRVVLAGPDLAVRTCARRLAAMGGRPIDPDPPRRPVPGTGTGAGMGGRLARELELPLPGSADDGAPVEADISWFGPADLDGRAGSEAVVQALTGLMHLHGRDAGRPRRIGVEIATVAAGVLAAQSVLALAVGRSRGRAVGALRTSVLQAGLLQASHYLAATTCEEEWLPAPPAPAPGPPFRTADDRWFEIETFDAEAWKGFWLRLGAPAAELGRAWTLFRPRYYRGTTSMPHGFHEATVAHSLAEATAAARDLGVSLCPVRTYDEVLAEPGRSAGHPHVEPLAAPGAPPGAAPGSAPRPAAGPGGRRGPGGSSSAELPLAGIEVVEATSRLQGPLAGLLLQMLGAHVTRVEPPGGDVGRGVPPLAEDTGSFFLAFNRGKDTVELDLGAPAGRAELAGLAAGADVFLHNWRPGKAEEWGLGPDDLAGRQPGLVYAAASGWDDGAGASRLIGTDFLVQAYCGLGEGIEPETRPPAPSRVLLTDFMGALNTCEGMLGGLYRRVLQGGRGCRVRTSLQAGAMTLQAHVLDGLDDGARDRPDVGGDGGRGGRPAGGRELDRRRGRPVWGPLDVPIEAADGFLVLDASARPTADAGDDVMARLCRLLDVDPDPGGRDELERRLVERVRQGTVEGWDKLLTDGGIACAAVTTDLPALADDARFAILFETLAGSCRAPASPWRFDTRTALP